MMIVVAYDISRDDKRDRVAKLLLSMGLSRIQRSLYAGPGGTAKARDIARAVKSIIDEETDRVDILLVPDPAWRTRTTLGRGHQDDGKQLLPGIHVA